MKRPIYRDQDNKITPKLNMTTLCYFYLFLRQLDSSANQGQAQLISAELALASTVSWRGCLEAGWYTVAQLA
jgi:hypothetical protein